jgi:curved DNA-binding protein CbpA
MSGNDSSPSELIDVILRTNSDHYQVLGVLDRQADSATLRRAYLRQCVKVHPDKNSDPRATLAFQKVALAWQVLSNDAARVEYDRALSRTAGGYEKDDTRPSSASTFQQQPSFKDAMFMFATVMSMMATGGGAASTTGDVAELLFWAEKMVQHQTDRGDASVSSNSSTDNMKQAAHTAMAVGSSLRVASATARMMGFKKSAASLEQTATLAQMAGMAGMVADAAKDASPAIQKALEQGGEQLQKLRAAVSIVRNLLDKNHDDTRS